MQRRSSSGSNADFTVINLGIFFDEATRNHPDNIAILDLSEAEPQSYTYTELETEVRRAARALASVGLRRRERCVISIPNGARFLAAFLGALRLGVIPVPINFRLGVETLQSIVRDAALRAIVGSPQHTATCCDIADRLGMQIRLSTDACQARLGRLPESRRETAGHPHRRAHGVRRHRIPTLHLGIDRHAQGHRAHPRRHDLGHRAQPDLLAAVAVGSRDRGRADVS